MKKTTIQRCVSFVLAVAMLSGLASSIALEVDPYESPEIPEEYVNLYSASAAINCSSGVATVESSGRTWDVTDRVYVSVKLQRMSNNTWTTLKTWSNSGTGHCFVFASWNIVPGYTYRNFTTVTVYTSSGSYVETVYKTSSRFY